MKSRLNLRANEMSLWLDRNRDFAPEPVVWALQQGMGESNISQRVHRANMGPQLTALYQSAQFIQLAAVLSGENEVVTRILAPGLNKVLW